MTKQNAQQPGATPAPAPAQDGGAAAHEAKAAATEPGKTDAAAGKTPAEPAKAPEGGDPAAQDKGTPDKQDGKTAEGEGSEPGKEGEGEQPVAFTREMVQVPEGVEFSDANKDIVTKYAERIGMKSPENFKALMEMAGEMGNESAKLQAEADKKAMEEADARNDESLRSDPDFGRDYEGNMKAQKGLLERYVSKDEARFLEKSGYSKHPIVVKMLARIARDMSDPEILSGGKAREIKATHDKHGNANFDVSKSLSKQ